MTKEADHDITGGAMTSCAVVVDADHAAAGRLASEIAHMKAGQIARIGQRSEDLVLALTQVIAAEFRADALADTPEIIARLETALRQIGTPKASGLRGWISRILAPQAPGDAKFAATISSSFEDLGERCRQHADRADRYLSLHARVMQALSGLTTDLLALRMELYRQGAAQPEAVREALRARVEALTSVRGTVQSLILAIRSLHLADKATAEHLSTSLDQVLPLWDLALAREESGQDGSPLEMAHMISSLLEQVLAAGSRAAGRRDPRTSEGLSRASVAVQMDIARTRNGASPGPA